MKKYNLMHFLVSLMITLFLTSCTTHEIIYVDNSNTTGIEDGSYEHPYTSIPTAIEKATHDPNINIVYIRMGSEPYRLDKGILIDLVSTKNLTIWGSGYNEGFPGRPASGYPVLKSSRLLEERPIYLKDVENVTIIGLDIRGGEQNVIYAAGSKNLTIKHNKISGAVSARVWSKTSGILIYGFGDGDESSDITITDNIIYDNTSCGINLSNFGDVNQDGDITQESTIKNVLIARNTFYQTQQAEHTMDLPIVVETWCGIVQNITIEDNFISNFSARANFLAAGIYFEQRMTPTPLTKDITIRNNKISNSDNDSRGIVFYVHTGKMSNINISGNTVSDVGNGIFLFTPGAAEGEAIGGGVIDGAVITENTIKNSLDLIFGGLMLVSLENGSLSAQVSRNTIIDGNGYGIWLGREATAELTADLGGGALQSVGYNAIYNNANGGIGIEDADVGLQRAMHNWWGQADDPASLIEGDIDYIPWLTTKP